VRALLLQ
jgi:hypothetical protein